MEIDRTPEAEITSEPARPRTSLWRNPDFIKLWIGQTISLFGSHITGNALPLTALLTLTATPVQMGILSALGTAPVVLIGLFAGVLVDRLRRRPILILADLGRALLLLSVPVAAITGLLGIEQLYLVAALAGILTVFFDVAYQSFLPTLLQRDELVEGNSKLATSDNIAEISGPPAAGVLVQIISAPLTILLDALSFLISAASIILIRKQESPVQTGETAESVGNEIAAGLKLVLGQPILRALAANQLTSTFFGSFYGTLYSLFVIRELHFGPALLGIFIGVGGAGALIGSLLASRFTRRYGLGRVIIGATLLSKALTFFTPLAAGPALFVFAILALTQFIGDIGWQVYFIGERSLIQGIVPDRLLGRANASMQVIAGAIAPVGAVLAGILAESIGIRATLLIASTGLFFSLFWLLASPIPSLRSVNPEQA